MMVTVVATQELEAGDVLRRFKAEAAQDKPRRGNNKNRYMYIYLGPVFGNCVAAHGILLILLLFFAFSPMSAQHRYQNHTTAQKHDSSQQCTPDPISSVLAAFPG